MLLLDDEWDGTQEVLRLSREEIGLWRMCF